MKKENKKKKQKKGSLGGYFRRRNSRIESGTNSLTVSSAVRSTRRSRLWVSGTDMKYVPAKGGV